MKTYIFHRKEPNSGLKHFYPLELKDDEDAIKNALANPGTIKVTDPEGRVIFPNA